MPSLDGYSLNEKIDKQIEEVNERIEAVHFRIEREIQEIKDKFSALTEVTSKKKVKKKEKN
jgi:flagellar capping protein FliD